MIRETINNVWLWTIPTFTTALLHNNKNKWDYKKYNNKNNNSLQVLVCVTYVHVNDTEAKIAKHI